MSLARRQTWARLLRRTLLGAAVVVCAAVLATGCREQEEEQISTQGVTLEDLQNMVVPRDDLGVLGDGLRVDGDSGWVTNGQAAEESVAPGDSGRSLSRRGRLGGYSLGYDDPRGFRSDDEQRPLGVSTELGLFRDEAAASAYMHREVDDILRFRGRELRQGKIASAERFGGGDVGDEAAGVRAALKLDDFVAYVTAVAFRRGRIVAFSVVTQRAETRGPADALQIADALDERISGVVTKSIDERPVSIQPQKWWHAVPDPRPLTLEAREVAPGARLTGRTYVRGRTAFSYFREYELVPDRALGGSRIVYLRTMTQAFRSSRLAKRHDAFLASGDGRERVGARFLRAWSRTTSFRPTGVTAGPVTTPARDTTAFRFSFDAPRGRLAGVLVSVRRGRLAGSVLAMGFDKELRSEDVLAVREKLLARLATA